MVMAAVFTTSAPSYTGLGSHSARGHTAITPSLLLLHLFTPTHHTALHWCDQGHYLQLQLFARAICLVSGDM